MAKNTRFVGLDVHAETIAVAVAEGRGKVRALGTIPNQRTSRPTEENPRARYAAQDPRTQCEAAPDE